MKVHAIFYMLNFQRHTHVHFKGIIQCEKCLVHNVLHSECMHTDLLEFSQDNL